jgi:hypothetical protein
MVLTPIPDEVSLPRRGRRWGNIITKNLFGKGFLQGFFYLLGLSGFFRPLSVPLSSGLGFALDNTRFIN